MSQQTNGHIFGPEFLGWVFIAGLLVLLAKGFLIFGFLGMCKLVVLVLLALVIVGVIMAPMVSI